MSNLESDKIFTHNNIDNSLENSNVLSLTDPYIDIINTLGINNEISNAQKEYYTDLIHKFSKFNLGKYLLKNRGLNGFWADYLINYPDIYKKSGCDPYGSPIGAVEKQLLEKLPITVATQNRHRIFKTHCQKQIKDNIRILSLPCGLSSEILQLDYSNISGFELIGIDIDSEALAISKQRAEKLNVAQYCSWLQQDAWKFTVSNLDLILSNGLTMYVEDDSLVQKLYSKFFNSLNNNGMLVTSFINPPPYFSPNSVWKTENIEPQFYEIQEILFNKVFQAKWHGYRTADRTKQLLIDSGFNANNIKIYPDDNNIFPTVTAVK